MNNLVKKTLLWLCFVLLATPLYPQGGTRLLELSDIWASREFIPSRIGEMRSMANGESYTLLESNAIIKYQYRNGKKQGVIVDGNLLKDVNGNKFQISDYSFDKSESLILLETSPEKIYRHSYKAYYYIYNIKNESLLPLSRKGMQRLAEFSPDGSKVAFVRDNNLFVIDVETGFETMITTDGENKKIINGTTDWVYEEEFSFTKGFQWSPDGKRIAYYRFDESEVKEFFMTIYGDLYPQKYEYKYPKAGEKNSIVSINVYKLNNKTTTKMNVGQETDQYIPRIMWTKDSEVLCIQIMNRLQNKLELLMANVSDGSSSVMYTEENKYYIDITDNLYFLEKNENFIITSEKDGFNHIYRFDNKGNQLAQITSGEVDVDKVYGIDERAGLVFYSAAESSPMNREIFSVKLDGRSKTMISDKTGYNQAEFSSGFKYYINTWSDANTPPVYSLYNRNGKKIQDIETNSQLVSNLNMLQIGETEFFTFKTNDDIDLNAWIMKPYDFSPNGKYPVLLYVYGGPGSQTVKNQWGWYNHLWFHMLTQKGYIVVSVDGRGTGFRGEEFKKCTYLQLGKYETEDLIETAKYLSTLTYVDSKRIGIFGWSYGGYMSSLCMTKGSAFFKAGIAVAPVTNWRFYDNIYTERFMRTPQENARGYDDNSPINFVNRLTGSYLLIHGTADDNVHVENTIEMADALIKANKQFDLMIYPNRNHGIFGGVTRLNLYIKMTDFILKNL